ncbi:MAG TPA: GNAT family N-acetyltransferase [Gaiellaceae bacterium]|nr:GNAT family N-acetyltransferase [Gaiellaceae bacterium]
MTLRAPQPGDAERIVAARDEEFHRWLGPGSETPTPFACIQVEDELVGWVDYDRDPVHDWLGPGEVNVGYFLFPSARGKGYASRAIELLLTHLRHDTGHRAATLLIHPENSRSLALADRLGFVRRGEVDGQPFFTHDLG